MTAQEAINWIRLDIDMTKFDPSTGEEAYLNDEAKKVIEAMEMAIDALSKQSASSEQADQCGNGTEMVELKLKKRTITERLIIAESLINSVITDSDQFREDTKKTEDALLNRYDVIKAVDRHTREDGTLDDDISCILEEVSPFEQKNSNSFSKEPPAEGNSEMNCSDVPDIHVGKTDFQPGDKFILELGEERRMFGEFEIKGTDLYVKTDLIEKLRRFDPDYMGEWIFHADWKRLGYAPYECNWCGRAFDYEMNYCGYCGAYMKRKAK